MPICSGCTFYRGIEEYKRKKLDCYSSKAFMCKLRAAEEVFTVWKTAATEFLLSIGYSFDVVKKETATALLKSAPSWPPTQPPTLASPSVVKTSTSAHKVETMVTPDVHDAATVAVEPPDAIANISDKPLPSASEQLEDDAASKSGRYFTSGVQVGKSYVDGFPNSHFAITWHEYAKLKKEREQLKQLQSSFTGARFLGTDLSRRLLATALLSVPVLSLIGAETFIPLVLSSFCAAAGQDIDIASLISASPVANTIRNVLVDYAIDCLIELSEEIKKAPSVFVAADKGNKKGVVHFVKVLWWYDKAIDAVQTFILDIDGSEGTSEACSDAIQHSLEKVYSTVKLSGQYTVSGGG
jgi:hypothetical protein